MNLFLDSLKWAQELSTLLPIFYFMGFVYKITSPTGRIYIGSTIVLDKRLKNYKNHNCKDQPKLYASFIKYGFTNHSFEIIEECDNDILRSRERYFGLLFNVLSKQNLNCSLPSDGEKVSCISEETRQLISNKLKGRKMPPHVGINLSKRQTGSLNHNFGKTASEQTRAKQSAASKGKPKSDEMRRKLKIAASNRSEEYKQNMSLIKKQYWKNRKQNEQQISLFFA